MQDEFYFLKKNTVKKVKEILNWAKNNSLKLEVDMLVRGQLARIPSDKSFDEVLGLLNTEDLPYFRIILRKDMNLYGILYDDLHIDDILEIGIRGIDVGEKEYFIFIYLDKKHLKELMKRYKFKADRHSKTKKQASARRF